MAALAASAHAPLEQTFFPRRARWRALEKNLERCALLMLLLRLVMDDEAERQKSCRNPATELKEEPQKYRQHGESE